jgi:hypothetical protein
LPLLLTLRVSAYPVALAYRQNMTLTPLGCAYGTIGRDRSPLGSRALASHLMDWICDCSQAHHHIVQLTRASVWVRAADTCVRASKRVCRRAPACIGVAPPESSAPPGSSAPPEQRLLRCYPRSSSNSNSSSNSSSGSRSRSSNSGSRSRSSNSRNSSNSSNTYTAYTLPSFTHSINEVISSLNMTCACAVTWVVGV